MLILQILLDTVCRYFTHHHPVSHWRCLLQVPVGQIQHPPGGGWGDSASAESGHGLFSTTWVGANCKPLASRPRSSDVGWPTVMSSTGASSGWLQKFQWRMRLRAYCASHFTSLLYIWDGIWNDERIAMKITTIFIPKYNTFIARNTERNT